MGSTTVNPPIDAQTLAGTVWADLPEPILQRLLLGSRIRRIPARGTVYGLADLETRAGVLLAGTARAFLAGADGRQLTVRYDRRGSLLARRSSLLGGRSPIAVHALTDVEMLELEPREFLSLVETEASVARAVLAELSRRFEDVYATVADSAFGTVREKVARHLLALSGDARPGERRISRITQQELADAMGTMREVVARTLRDLRREGIVATAPGSVEILKPDRLERSLGAWQLAAAEVGQDVRQDIEAMLEASPNAILTVGPDGEITHLNSLAEATFGWAKAELVGRQVETLLPEHVRELHVHHRADFLGHPEPRPLYLRDGLRARRRDGTEFPVSVGLSLVDTRSGAMVLATVVDRSAG